VRRERREERGESKDGGERGEREAADKERRDLAGVKNTD